MRASTGASIEPSPNGQRPASARNSVVLPAPDGPRTSQREPGFMAMLRTLVSGSPLGSASFRLCVTSWLSST